MGDSIPARRASRSAQTSTGIIGVWRLRAAEQVPWITRIAASRLRRTSLSCGDGNPQQEEAPKKQAEADLLREAEKHPIVAILETTRGFGPIRAARPAPAVVTSHRLRTKRWPTKAQIERWFSRTCGEQTRERIANCRDRSRTNSQDRSARRCSAGVPTPRQEPSLNSRPPSQDESKSLPNCEENLAADQLRPVLTTVSIRSSIART